MKKLLIFLDFDGVLNSESGDFGNDKECSLKHLDLERYNIKSFFIFLQMLEIRQIDYEIVLETAWGMNMSFKMFMNKLRSKIKLGENDYEEELFEDILKNCVDKTTTLNIAGRKGNPKAPEIEHWLMCNNVNTDETMVMIIDDEPVFLQYYRFTMLNINTKDGFTLEDSDEAIKLYERLGVK